MSTGSDIKSGCQRVKYCRISATQLNTSKRHWKLRSSVVEI